MAGHSFTFNAPVQNVYAPGGDMVLNQNSTPSDLAHRIEEMRAQVRALQDIDAASRAAVEAKLEAAEQEGRAARPDAQRLKTLLDTSATTLESATGAADKALGLAKTLFNMGKWVAAVLC